MEVSVLKNTFLDRIRQFIDNSGLSKSAVAEKLGVSPAFISQMYSGVRTPSDRTIADICRVFDIREEWLRDGLEPMRSPKSREEEVAELVGSALNGDNNFKKAVIRMICSRTDAELETLNRALREIYENM